MSDSDMGGSYQNGPTDDELREGLAMPHSYFNCGFLTATAGFCQSIRTDTWYETGQMR